MTEFLNKHGMVDLQDLPYRTIEVDIQDLPTFPINEIDLWQLIQTPPLCVKLVEGQILEKFIFEEIEIQDIDKCKICDSPSPRLYSAKKRVHDRKLETPKINTVKIHKIPKEEIRLDVSKPTRNPTLHSRQTHILGSKLDRRVKSMRLGKQKGSFNAQAPFKTPRWAK